MIRLAGARQGRAAGVADRDHEPLYVEALLASPDRCLAGFVGSDGCPGHALKGLARTQGGGLLACMERELLWLDGAGAVQRRWSHPWLNDVHHAIEHDGALWVASTGADAVLEVRGEAVTPHLLGGGLPAGDLRGRSLKPHAVHPNHLFVWQDEVWVTCLRPGHARALRSGRLLPVADVGIHDGVVHDGRVWFTTVDGTVVATDGRTREVLDLHARLGEGPLGWCRGLAFEAGTMWVGFTRLRATRWRHQLAWLKGQLRGRVDVTRQPTRLVAFDGGDRTADLESLGVHAVFGLVGDTG